MKAEEIISSLERSKEMAAQVHPIEFAQIEALKWIVAEIEQVKQQLADIEK